MVFSAKRRTATFLLAPLFAGVLTACQEPAPEAEPLTLETPSERLSYGVALRIGQRMKTDGMMLDVEAYAQGLRDAFDNAEAKLTDEEINAELVPFRKRFGEERKRQVCRAGLPMDD